MVQGSALGPTTLLPLPLSPPPRPGLGFLTVDELHVAVVLKMSMPAVGSGASPRPQGRSAAPRQRWGTREASVPQRLLSAHLPTLRDVLPNAAWGACWVCHPPGVSVHPDVAPCIRATVGRGERGFRVLWPRGFPPTPRLCSPPSGSRGWSAGWARCSCRKAPPGPRRRRPAARCAAGAATCRGSSTASTRVCASRSSSASSEVSPARPGHLPSPSVLQLLAGGAVGGRSGPWGLEQSWPQPGVWSLVSVLGRPFGQLWAGSGHHFVSPGWRWSSVRAQEA